MMHLILKAAPIQRSGIIINDVPKNTASKIRDKPQNFGDTIKVTLLLVICLSSRLSLVINSRGIYVRDICEIHAHQNPSPPSKQAELPRNEDKTNENKLTTKTAREAKAQEAAAIANARDA